MEVLRDAASWPVGAAIGIALLALIFGAVRGIRWWRSTRSDEIPLVFSVDSSGSSARQTTPIPPLVPVPSEHPLSPPQMEPELFDGRTIRFYRPPAKTLQLIPGRLEVITGEDRSEVIRFVRTSGGTPEVTLGRGEGPPLQHIQFRAATVSRQHARMSYVNSSWVIRNLSSTNPVVVNGIELVPPADQRVLFDGDEIELGEIVFRFHSR